MTDQNGSGSDYQGSFDVGYTFVRRPLPLPADMRPTWRSAMLLLILNKCHGDSAGIDQLHVLNHASRSVAGRATFLRAINGQGQPEDVIVRFDPTLPRAIDLVVGKGWAKWFKGRLSLTDQGRGLVREVYSHASVMMDEKAFLAAVPRKVGHATISRMLEVLL